MRRRITNAAALEMLRELHRQLPPSLGGHVRPDYLGSPGLPVPWGSKARDYQAWVRARLHSSQLATLIPGGLDLLPDIYSALPEPYRRMEYSLRPRRPRQLAQHLVLYLDWYLDPSSPLTLPAMLVTLPRRAPLFVGAVSLSALAALAFAPLLLLVYAPLFFCWAWAVPGRDLDVGGDMRRIIHGAELLLYLRESYADPPAEYDEPAVTEQVLASPAALP